MASNNAERNGRAAAIDAVYRIGYSTPCWKNMSTSNEQSDLEKLRQSILAELEQEHQEREDRAQRKADRRKQQRQKEKERNKEVEALRAQMRRDFYADKGYEERIDPTGRRMYLSPAELENKKKRKGRKRSRKKSFRLFEWIQSNGMGEWAIYIVIAGIAAVTGLILASG